MAVKGIQINLVHIFNDKSIYFVILRGSSYHE